MSSEVETGILLLSHGSRLDDCEEVITEIADMYRKTTDNKVEIGFMEMRMPDIPTAINNLVEGTNIQKIIVVPVFVAHGIHTKRDIPKILGIESEDTHDHDHEGHHHDHGHDHGHSHGHHHGHGHSHEVEKVDFDGEIIFTDPLGADPLLVEIIKRRVDDAL